MKKLYPLLSVLFLIYWGCEDKETPPTEVTLWGEIYSIENTTELDLSGYDLTGSIPPEIGNLVNMTILRLDDNQLTGSFPPELENLINLIDINLSNNLLTGLLPDEICNLRITSLFTPTLYRNKFCPPYPICVENSVGYQDTSDCD